jgi:hypothetical protein
VGFWASGEGGEGGLPYFAGSCRIRYVLLLAIFGNFQSSYSSRGLFGFPFILFTASFTRPFIHYSSNGTMAQCHQLRKPYFSSSCNACFCFHCDHLGRQFSILCTISQLHLSLHTTQVLVSFSSTILSITSPAFFILFFILFFHTLLHRNASKSTSGRAAEPRPLGEVSTSC